MSGLIPQAESLARVVVAVLLNSIWEDALLVFAVWLLLRSLRNTNASTRYFCWLVTLVAAVLLPAVTTVPQIRALDSAAVPAAALVAPAASAPSHPVKVPAKSAAPSSAATSAEAASSAPRFRTPERLHVLIPSWLASVLFGAWILAALMIAVRLAVDLVKLEALKRDSLPLPVEYRDQMERWVKAAYGNARDVRLCVSERIEVPVAVGLFDSMILLPKHLLAELDAGELDRISLHELAHLHRSDDWTNSIQRFTQVLMFFNPAIRFIGSQLDLEREVACDDWVLELTGEVRPYATCLTKMAELTAWPHRALAAPGVFVTRKGISIRIERLLNKHRNARVKVAYGVPSIVAGALVLFFAIATFVTPVIAYTTESASSTVAGVSQRVVTLTKQIRHKQIPATPPPPAAAAKPVIPLPAPSVRTVTRTIYVPEVKTTVKMRKHFVKLPANRPFAPLGVPAQPGGVNVHIPAINVHVPATDVHVPAFDYRYPAQAARAAHLPHGPMRLSGLASNEFTCTGCNFEGADWAGKDLSNRSFVGSNFDHANLQGANFSGANLSGVNFSRANLRNANFTNAHMSGCNLSGADITGARFDGAHISGCGGVNARSLDQSQLHVWLSHCAGCDFEGADLHNMDLRGLHLSGINLSHANLRGADLSGAALSGVNLSGADLNGARVSNTRFSGCEFDRTDLRNLDLSTASFSGSDMTNAIMR